MLAAVACTGKDFCYLQSTSSAGGVNVQEPCDWHASSLSCCAEAALDKAGRIAFTTALVAELGRPQALDCGGDMTAFQNRLERSVDAWLHSKIRGNPWWWQAAEEDAAAELKQFEHDMRQQGAFRL